MTEQNASKDQFVCYYLIDGQRFSRIQAVAYVRRTYAMEIAEAMKYVSALSEDSKGEVG